jgi:hypothetical protein
MTTTARTPEIDEARVEAFAEQLFTDLAGAATTVMTVVCDRLGLYAAMAGTGPTTAADLAATTGLHPRLVTEWLASQTVSGYVTHDPTAPVPTSCPPSTPWCWPSPTRPPTSSAPRRSSPASTSP